MVRGGGLRKTVQFGDSKYVGDPINAVKIFNEKEVDELIVLDIDATAEKRNPDYVMIKNLAAECRMPLCYGGGVKSAEQVEKIVGMGVEKVAVSSAAVDDPQVVARMAESVGSQSVVVVLDVRRRGLRRRYEVHTQNGRKPSGRYLADFASELEELGAGEIVVNSIDNDGVMKGYDLAAVSELRDAVSLPITALGGAGSLEDIRGLIDRFGIIGAAAGSLFVFKGVYRAVLINYPSRAEKDALITAGLTR